MLYLILHDLLLGHYSQFKDCDKPSIHTVKLSVMYTVAGLPEKIAFK